MPTDADFLATIAAAPTDHLPKLVYADWLDDRGDPRGELIRVEEQTRHRVGWDDTLWRLKPRRNELRAQADADWVKAMGYGQTCEPLFRGQPFPTDVTAAWRLIREAHERWTGDPMPDVGGHADRVAGVEKRLGLTLPPSLREYVAFARDWRVSRRRRERRSHHRAHALHPVPGHAAVSLHRRGYHCDAVRFEDFTRPDPPVTVYVPEWDENGEPTEERFGLATDQHHLPLSEFVFDQACQLLGAAAGEMSDDIQRVDEVRSRLHELFPFRIVRGGGEWYEGTNLTAVFQVPARNAPASLRVRACRPVGESDLSPWLLAVCRTDGYRSGVFRDLQRQYLSDQRVAVGLPPITDDDIPF